MSVTPEINALRSELEGRLLVPEDPDYEEARKVWNGMVDSRPAIIAQCEGTADVAEAVRFARAHGLVLAVRGGGHNVAGNASCEGGLVVDLRPMKKVEVDAERKLARAQGGVTWAEYDRATQASGLASPGGAISSTGIAGLTLGGGFGWLSRSYGLACDNLVAAEVVTATGDVVRASADENPDLFWGLRGGGGNFGVVTSFEYRLHPVGELLSGLVLYPRAAAPEFLRLYAKVTAAAPEQLSSMGAMLCSPEGEPVVGAFLVYHGDMSEGEKVVAPLRTFGTPLVDDVGPKPYTLVQQAFDPGFPSGNRNYWKSNYLNELSEDCVDTLVQFAERAPSPMSVVGIEHMMGGAVARVDRADTAFGSREAEYNLLLLGMWADAGDDVVNTQWTRDFWTSVQPFSTGRVYVNYMDQDEPQRISDAYDEAQYRRLRELKQRYDPENLFHRNQNISPAAG